MSSVLSLLCQSGDSIPSPFAGKIIYKIKKRRSSTARPRFPEATRHKKWTMRSMTLALGLLIDKKIVFIYIITQKNEKASQNRTSSLTAFGLPPPFSNAGINRKLALLAPPLRQSVPLSPRSYRLRMLCIHNPIAQNAAHQFAPRKSPCCALRGRLSALGKGNAAHRSICSAAN